MSKKISNQSVEDIIALSPTQEGILYHCLKEPDQPLYLSQVALLIEGELSSSMLQQALHQLVQAHGSLRSVIRWEKLSQPVQIVLKQQDIPLQYEDWSERNEAERQQAWINATQWQPDRSIDLEKGPLLRAHLYRQTKQQYKLLVQFHHIIMDGWSLGVLLSEWLQTYDAMTKGVALTNAMPHSYKTYIQWLQQYDNQTALQFWEKELSQLHSQTRLPQTQQQELQPHIVDSVTISLQDIMPAIEKFARTYNVTANAIINAAWALLLQRYNDSDESVYGLTVSGRPDDLADVERMIGLFINTIPIIVNEPGHLSSVEYIQRIHNKFIELKQAEHLSLSDIQGASPFRGAGSLFNHILVFENYPLDVKLQQGAFQDFTITGYEELEINHYDMTISFLLAAHPVLKVEYQSRLFERETVQKLCDHFLIVVDQLIGQPELLIGEIGLLTEQEKHQLLYEFNQTERTFAKQDMTVYELFAETAATYPDYTAVVYQQDQLSYRELLLRTERLAAHLRSLGGSEGKIVALLMDWSTDMITAIMGVLGSGCAYLPIDPNYPEERIRYIVESSKAHMVVTMPDFEEMASTMAEIVVVLNAGECWSKPDAMRLIASERVVDFPLAYVIYTSGSTGQPKGVMIDQKSFAEFVLWTLEEYEHKPGYQVLLSNSYAFDSSIQQIFSPLISGGALHLIHPDLRKNADQYLDYMQQHRINSIDEIPVLMNVLVEHAEQRKERPVLPDLTSLSLGSEYVPIQLVRKCREVLNPTGKIINGYGPAETTVETSTYHFDGSTEQEISLIGKPRSNLKVYIVDQHQRLCPIGVAGEICVSGLGLSRGYLGRPELTAERFVENPFSNIPGDRMYKTGDAGQWQPDGNIQYIGRIDNQVKIRGYRVEMGEIEDALLQYADIQDAVVVVQGKETGNPVLCAFLKSMAQPSAEQLQAFLEKRLPDYMIPQFFEYVDAYPLNPNGKIDRKVLEKKVITRHITDHSEPRHDMDRKLVAIWGNILQLPTVGIYSNFFELGGNSIQIMRVYSQIKKQYPDHELEISDLFSHNTIAQLSDYLLAENEAPQTSDEQIGTQPILQSSALASERDDVAVVGIGVRLPEVEGADEFWKLLVQGKETIRDIPEARKELDPGAQFGKTYLKYGYMDGIDQFDPAFFGIPPKLARSMDPNQRIMLETAYLAIEDAGYGRKYIHNRSVGVFMGGILPEYYQHLDLKVDELMSSNLPANLAGRVSYHFGLNGPSMVIETACSSSLTAVHTAVQAMRNGECEMALVGGVHLDIEPVSRDLAMESNIVSPSESCRAFSEEADGTIGGEGSICILLKSKSQAIKDNDRIYAVIKGSAVTQDGSRSNGITAPSPDAQAETIQRAWANANIDPLTISYIEAHGTGTRLGDPIEIKGIQKAYRPHTDQTQFIRLGSVKSNLGHLDSAAGLAGLVKTALSLHRQQLPASLHAEPLNSLIDFRKSPVQVNSQLENWQSEHGNPLRAGVSSFGLSGTNVHVVLEQCTEQPAIDSKVNKAVATQASLFVLSGTSPAVVQHRALQLKRYVQENAEVSLQDISYTLNCRRDHAPYRTAVVASERMELIEALNEVQITHTQDSTNARLNGDYSWEDLIDIVKTGQYPASSSTMSHEDWLQQQGAFTEVSFLNSNEVDIFIRLLATAYRAGHHLKFAEWQQGHLISLPPYPFDRKSYWLDMKALRSKRGEAIASTSATRKADTIEMINDQDSLLQVLDWQPESLDYTATSTMGTVLLLGAIHPFNERLTERLSRQSDAVIRVQRAKQYRQLEEHSYELDENDEQQIATLLKQLESKGYGCTACLYVHDSSTWTYSLDQQSLEDKIQQSFTPAWNWTRQLGLYAGSRTLRLLHVTRNAERVLPTDEMVNPLAGLVTSLSRSANHEYIGLQSYCVDIAHDISDPDIILGHISDELFGNADIKEVAYRHGIRYAQQLQPISSSPSIPLPLIRPNGVYIITGGTGGIAEHICQSIADQHPVTFILLGRTERSQLRAVQEQALLKLAASGSTVHYMQVDVANRHALAQTIQDIQNQYGTVNGVIHAAGIMGQRHALHELTMQHYQDVYEAKVYATLWLDELLRDHMLDFFLAFSSVDAVLSEKNLGPYTSANHFMDQYAMLQRQRGRQFMSIRWGGWQFTGMGNRTGTEEESHIDEIARLSPLILGFDAKQGVQAFWRIMNTRRSHVLVTGLDHQDIKALEEQAYFKIAPELQELRQANAHSDADLGASTLDEIEAMVGSIWVKELELEKVPALDDNYFSIGGDSILGIDIAVQLSQMYKLQLDANTLFRYDTIRLLSAYIYDQLQSAQPAAKITSIPKAVPVKRAQEEAGKEVRQ